MMDATAGFIVWSSGLRRSLFENPRIVLFSMDEAHNFHARPARFIGDEVFLEFADSPNANSRMFSLAHSCGCAHAGVISEINIMNDKVPPGGGTLDGANHRLRGLSSFADPFKGLTFHGIEILSGRRHAIATFLRFI